MGITQTAPYDAAEFLVGEESIAAYLAEAQARNDPQVIAKAMAAVARARSLRAPQDDQCGTPA
jgi:probable addiction module antidote protein